MFLLADGTKELSVTDNMGSVRFILSSQGNRQYLDYKPFGGLLYSYTGKNNRENADGSIYDEESELQMMGARMYDDETGRFTSVDPLWAAFPAQSPYSYAYNSPLTWRDPTGLAPEKEKVKEKDKDRLQSIIWDPSLIEAMWAAAMADISMQNCLRGRYSTGQDADGQPMLHGMAICAYYKPPSPGGGGSVMGGSHSGGNGGGRKAEGGSAPNGQGGQATSGNSTGGKDDNSKNSTGIQITSNTDKEGVIKYKGGKLYNADGTEYKGSDAFVMKVFAFIEKLASSTNQDIKDKLCTLENSDNPHEIIDYGVDNTDQAPQTMPADNDEGTEPTVSVGSRILLAPSSGFEVFVHEFMHSYLYETATNDYSKDWINGLNNREIQAVQYENEIRMNYGLPARFNYSKDNPIPGSLMFPR